MQKFVTTVLFAALFLVFATAQVAQAQEREVSGAVTDAADGQPIPGANIVVEGTTTGTTTDAAGEYSVTVPGSGATLVFSFVGYQAQRVPVGDQATIDVQLQSDIEALDEVVVVGYGTQQRQNLTGSVSSVDVEAADAAGISASPQDLIQGAAAGVSVTRSNGEPGSGMNVRIRGGTSINASNTPLYVVDGVPIDNGSVAPGGYGTARNPLNFLNASDIESIEVLKDAAAAAIYGARGANGVVLITTKGGQDGRVQVDYNGSVSTSAMSRKLDLLSADEYRGFIQEQVDAGNLSEERLTSLGDANTDWQDAVTRTAVSQKHNLALSGGMENAQYRASLGYANEEGIVISSGQERLTGRFNASLQTLEDRLQLNANVSTAYIEDDHVPYEETGGFEGAAFAGILKSNPTYPVRSSDGDFFEYSESTRNPVAAAHQVADFSETSRTIANITAELDILDPLSAKVNLGVERSEATRNTYLPKDSPFGENTGGRAEKDHNEKNSKLLEVTTNYDDSFGAHNLNVVVGYSYQDWYNEGFGAAGEQFISDYWQHNNLGAGGNEELIPYSYKNMHKLISGFGRVNYNYDSRYLLSLSLRRDGSTRFGPNTRWGFFPSASVAWRISQDISLPEVVTDLKLRAGYGTTGNQEGIDNYAALQTLAPGYRAVFGQQAEVGVAPNQFANPDLQWEETATFNAGIDYAFYSGRLSGSLEYYRKDTDHLLVNIPVPQPAVVDSRLENVGMMRNSGVELSLEALAVDSEDLTVSIRGNVSTNKNEIVQLGAGRDRIIYGSVSGPGLTGVQSFLIEAGLPVGTFYGPVFAGFENGEQIFEDYEDTDGDGVGDEVVGTTTSPSTEDRQIIGDAQPDLIYGLSGRVAWKNWNLSVSLNGKQGQDVFNNTGLTYAAKTQAQTSNNFLASALDAPTDIDESPVYSSRWIQDGSYLRLSSVNLGYTFTDLPQVQQARVYVQGSNLFVLTSYDGYDPEVQTDNAGALPTLGVDYLNYPRPRTFTLGVSLNI